MWGEASGSEDISGFRVREHRRRRTAAGALPGEPAFPHPLWGPNLAALGWMALYAAIVGWGLVSLRRWSVVLLAIPTLATGLFLVIGSVLEVPFPWSLINIAMGVALCAPALLASLCWRGLR